MPSPAALGKRRRHKSSRRKPLPPSARRDGWPPVVQQQQQQRQPPPWPLEIPYARSHVLKTEGGKLCYVRKDTGLINPRDELYKDIFESVSGYLDRTHCMLLLHALSKTKVRVHLQVGNTVLTKPAGKGDSIDLATVLILSIALRSRTKESNELVGELIGLANSETLKRLPKYIRPPLASPSILTSLVNATVRQITQPRHANDGNYGPLELFQLVPPIIAGLIVKPKEPASAKFLRKVLSKLVASHEDEHEERGMKLGLVLVGVRIALRRLLEKAKKTSARIELFIDCLLGALGNVSSVLSVFQPLVKQVWTGRAEQREKHIQEIFDTLVVQKLVDGALGRSKQRFNNFKKCMEWIRVVDGEWSI